MDTSTLSGEPLPVAIAAGMPVLSGSANAGAPFDVRADRPAAESAYAALVRLVQQSQADRVSGPMRRATDEPTIMSGSRTRPGRLGLYVDGYGAWLLELGYSSGSVTRSLTALGHLGRWMDRRDTDVEQLNGDVLNAFLADHVDRYGHLPSAGVMPLLDYFRCAGVVAPEPTRRRRRFTGSLVNIGAGWLLSGRSRPRPSAGTRGHPTGSSRNESRLLLACAAGLLDTAQEAQP